MYITVKYLSCSCTAICFVLLQSQSFDNNFAYLSLTLAQYYSTHKFSFGPGVGGGGVWHVKSLRSLLFIVFMDMCSF